MPSETRCVLAAGQRWACMLVVTPLACMTCGKGMTESPTSKSPMARERHSPPGQMRSGPTPLSTRVAGPAGGRQQNKHAQAHPPSQPGQEHCKYALPRQPLQGWIRFTCAPEPEKSMGAMVLPMASTRRRSPLCVATRWSTARGAGAVAKVCLWAWWWEAGWAGLRPWSLPCRGQLQGERTQRSEQLSASGCEVGWRVRGGRRYAACRQL